MATQIYHSSEHALVECSNATLLERVRQGDQLAWQRMLDKYEGLVRSVTRSFRLQQADVSDAVQTTWLRLLQSAHTVRDPERLAGWLAVTATRECLSVLRKHSTLHVDPNVDETPDPAVDLEGSVTNRETAHTLWAAVADLPPRQRDLILALFREDFDSYDDVAAKCAMPLGSIGPTRARALSRLRQKLAERGIGPDER
jgi:RNA polymerase sigma factor (sigma-70 family)